MERDVVNKHNLLHVVGSLGIGGAEMMLLHYTKTLGDNKYKHFVYCFGGDGPVRYSLENLGASVAFGPRVRSISNPLMFTFSIFSLFKNLCKFIQDNKIHTIHSHNAQSDKVAVVVGKMLRVPAFPTIHSTKSILDKRSRLDPRVYINKAVDKIIYRIADRVIAVSDEVKDAVCSRYHLKDSSVIVVRNGIFPNFKSKKDLTHRAEVKKDSRPFKILAVGRLSFEKNFDVLIKASSCILEKGHDYIYVKIVGDGTEYDNLTKLKDTLHLGNNLELLGKRNDVLELMQEADLFVMSSRYEGLSIAMIEAFSCGLPIIASDAPGLKDCVVHNENGMLFPIGDYVALSECILKITHDRNLRAYLSRGAQRSFWKNYDMRRNIEPLSQLMCNYRINK